MSKLYNMFENLSMNGFIKFILGCLRLIGHNLVVITAVLSAAEYVSKSELQVG